MNGYHIPLVCRRRDDAWVHFGECGVYEHVGCRDQSVSLQRRDPL